MGAAAKLDFLLTRGNVVTMSGGSAHAAAREPRAEAVGIVSDRIVAVGSAADLEALADADTKRINLAGRTVLPGFDDAHAHVWKIGHLLTSMVDLRRCGSLVELEGTLRARERCIPEGAWLQGRGFNEAKLLEGRRPTRLDLDRVSATRPILLTRACGHIFVANSAALRVAGIDRETGVSEGGIIERDAGGEPNGLLHETAIGHVLAVLPPPSAAEYEAMIDAALRHQVAHGITSTSDCGVTSSLLEVYYSMARQGTLRARVNVMPLGKPDDGAEMGFCLPAVFRDPMLQVDTVKYLADGGLSGATAALSLPYRGSASGSIGVLRFETEELEARCLAAVAKGWGVAVHAIGDRTLDQVLGIFERCREQGSTTQHRIEHFGLPTEAMLRRAARAGVSAVPQTIFLLELGRNFLDVLPHELIPRTYPVRSMLDAGVLTALSSDAPVVEDDGPLTGIMAAVLRTTSDGAVIAPDQAITVDEALYAYTVGGALVSGRVGLRGSIEPGKWADLVVLSDDPTKSSPERLGEIRVEMTMVAGRIVFEA